MINPPAIDNSVHALTEFLQRHHRVLLLTGAGLSTASGIPGYRNEEGERLTRNPIQGPEFQRSPQVRKRYWARSMIGWRSLSKATPNAGHLALAALEKHGRIAHTVTQNVDGLHQKAGSQTVTELHGSIHAVICLGCGSRHNRAELQARLEMENADFMTAPSVARPDGDAELALVDLEDFRVPTCLHCGGVLKPDVVFFGDNIPRHRAESVIAAMTDADALLVVGSSLMVYSGYRLCRMAAETGKPIALVNLGKTRADALIQLNLQVRIEALLPPVAAYFGATS